VNASKTLGVALVEQAGMLLGMAIYLVIAQHVITVYALRQPSDSWLIRIKGWWLDLELRAEKRRLAPWTLKESSLEPTPGDS
jgi:hypothetical protein